MFGRKLLIFFLAFNLGSPAWSEETVRPNLVETSWLAENLKKPDIVLIDMSDNLQYQRFHLPGAINLPYDYLNQTRNRVSLSIGQTQIIKLLGQIGVRRDSHVVIYDDTGGLHASRLFWELEQLGHPKISLLDGGLVKWIREGRKVSYRSPALKPATYSPLKAGKSATATLDEVSPQSRNNKVLLLDVRTPEEYTGNPKYPRSGHIPGALFWQWDQALNIDKGFTIKKNGLLEKELGKVGLTDKQQPVIVYCRSGHRASHTYFTLRQLGFENVKLYDASMKEYERQKGLPVKKGKEP